MRRFIHTVTIFISFLLVSFIYSEKAQAAFFNDVSYKYWAYEDINFISEHGVIKGYSGGNFIPGAIITRKDASIMLTRALDLTHRDFKPKTVKDLQPNSPGYNEVSIAIERGWLTLNNGKFQPNAPLTRDEMSRMLAIAYSYEGKQTSEFSDVPVASTYYPYIDAIDMYGVTTGYNDGTFRPKEKVTRAQFSAFITRVYQNPIAYEVKSGGKVVAVVPSVDDALVEVANYSDGTIHPQSNKFVQFHQTIAADDKTGIESGVLIFNGYNETEQFTPQFFNNYMRYKTGNGSMVDMFDTFIVLGLRYNEENSMFVDVPSNQANYVDWDNYIEKTFDYNGALSNLNASAAANNREVDLYLTIPYPKRTGDIVTLDGEERANSLYSRYDLTNWYIKKVIEEVEKANYGNLNFKGFYWISETVRTADDEVLVSSVASLLKRHDKFFIYSPHSASTNFNKWRDYGFDAAFLQPNAFRFAVDKKEERLHRAFINAQIYGSGINLEIDSHGINLVENGVESFNLYLDFSKRYGLDEKGMIFYQAVNMVERMATIDHPVYRSWYDQLNSTFFPE